MCPYYYRILQYTWHNRKIQGQCAQIRLSSLVFVHFRLTAMLPAVHLCNISKSRSLDSEVAIGYVWRLTIINVITLVRDGYVQVKTKQNRS